MKIFKNIIVLSILLLLSISLLSCTESDDEKESLTEKVITFEENQNKLENLAITYEEYKENVDDVTTDNFLKSKDKDVLIVIDEKAYTNSDLNDLSKSQIENLKKEVKDIEGKMKLTIIDKRIEVSKAYETEDENKQYIFSKTTEIDESDTEIIMTKRYTLIKEDDNWKIQNIHFDVISVPRNTDQDELVSNLKYQTKNNEEIKYVKDIDLMEL
ncbi:MAG: hypothetical protein ACTHVE_02790 [Senegalia sp. (in: firmicutes)]|uniref:hypothetical protein n=1 Tax=Senegalia sp. (in: firmicutes) TaxID=1924098 RepID=UPI003F9DAEFD